MKKLLLVLGFLSGCYRNGLSMTNAKIEATIGCLAHDEVSYMITSREGIDIGAFWGFIEKNKNYDFCNEFIQKHKDYWCKPIKIRLETNCP